MQYQEAVEEARELVESTEGADQEIAKIQRRTEEGRWRLAELTFEQVEAGATRSQWAEDVGISGQWAGVLYKTWKAFRERPGFPDERPLFTEAWRPFLNTGREAEGGQEIGRAKATLRKAAPEHRAEVVREAMADPVVRREIMSDPDTRRVTDNALAEQYKSRSTPSSQEAAQRRESSQRETDLLDLRDNLNRAAGLLRIALRQALETTLTGQERDFIRASAEEAVEQAGNWQAYLGGQNLDAFLAELTEGES
jgi:hypothetical protein